MVDYRRRLVSFAAVTGLLLGAVVSAPASASTSDQWEQLLARVSDFSERAIDHGGLLVYDPSSPDKKLLVDFRHGYQKIVDEYETSVANWAGQSFRRIDRGSPALALMGSNGAKWSSDEGEGAFALAAVFPEVVLMAYKEAAISSVRTDGAQRYVVDSIDGARLTVQVGLTSVSSRMRGPDDSWAATWTMSSRRVQAPTAQEVVDSRDLERAEHAVGVLEAVRQVRRGLRTSVRRARAPVRAIRVAAWRELQPMGLRVSMIPSGAKATVRERYLRRTWRIVVR